MADRKQGVNAVLHALATPVRHKLFGGSWAHGKEELRLLGSEQRMGAGAEGVWDSLWQSRANKQTASSFRLD